MKALITTLLVLAAGSAHALNAAEYQASLVNAARAAEPGFSGFSAQRGEAFYRSSHGGKGDAWSCASCHTDNPAATGTHAVTRKVVKPLAPSANPARFTDAEKIEKWFKRNCNDVLKRACTPREQGDLIAYLLTVK